MHKDYLMRQIEFISTAVGEILFFWKEPTRQEQQAEVRQLESDLLYVLLCNMLDKNNINGAEDLLFDMLDKENPEHFLIAIDFYKRINGMTNEELKKANFSREEIERGLSEIKAIYGLPS